MPSIPEGWASLGSISFALAVLLGCRNSARFRYFIAISPSFIAFLDSTPLPPLLASVGRYGLLSLDGAPGGGRLWRVLERSTPERKKRAHNCLASRRGGSSFLTLARSRPLPRKNRTESFHICLFSTFFLFTESFAPPSSLNILKKDVLLSCLCNNTFLRKPCCCFVVRGNSCS